MYEAFDEERRVPVAVKALQQVDPSALDRFRREFRALQGLSHPNLVALDELFFDEGKWFFTMELLRGADFVSYVRGVTGTGAFQNTVRLTDTDGWRHSLPDTDGPTAMFNEERLREGLRQLFEGLAVLHAAGKIHRDVKPSNVIVTTEDRVVIVDFGLVTEAAAGASMRTAIVGTPAYMAPEQGVSHDVTPAADVYSVGTILYEILTGAVPFQGPPLQVLLDKREHEAPAPIDVVPSTPPDLSALCADLLRIDPLARPTAKQALARLAPSLSRSGGYMTRRPPEADTFVGRERELAALHEALEESTRKGTLVTMLVCGESGIGKSSLVRHFTASVLADRPDAMLLQGRCYERETVPYKTLDGVVDALCRKLSRAPDGTAAALLPARPAVLAKVFPAMLRIPQVAGRREEGLVGLSPEDVRRVAFGALRDMFMRVSLKFFTVIVIDDLQWADDDGLRALAEILRPPESPPLLLVGTVRITEGAADPTARLREVLPSPPRVLRLPRLSPDEACRLASALLPGVAASADPVRIAREAGGHPLFVEELARHVGVSRGATSEVVLDDAIWGRVSKLDPVVRSMAELLAVAGKPVPLGVIGTAARCEPAEVTPGVAALRAAKLVRMGAARSADTIEPYHDRVREAVLAKLDAERRRALHQQLAIAFESSSHHNPETLATHWRGAGDASRAAVYAATAGDQAFRAFAFDRAASWYEQAFELTDGNAADRRALRAKLANALAFAGRGAQAAEHFEALAATAPPAEALDLRRRAADQLVRIGHFDRGMEATRTVLAAIGMRMPTTMLGTLAMLVWFRVLFRLRGLRFEARPPERISPELLTRIETCWAIGSALVVVDTFLAFVFTTRALLLALHAGSQERVACCVGMDLTISGTAGGARWRRTERLMEYARDLGEKAGTTAARAYGVGPAGVALFLNGKFREASERLEYTFELLRDGSSGLIHERTSMRMFLIFALAMMGKYKVLRRHQQEGLHEALARGDVYAAVTMRSGYPNMSWLCADQPDLAEQNAESAIRDWSKRGFHLEHYYGIRARVCVRLYRGNAIEAHALATELVRSTQRSMLARIQFARLRAIHLRGAAALAVLARSEGDRAALLAQVRRDAKEIARERMPWADGLVTVLRAGADFTTGDRAAASRGLERAARELEGADMLGYANAARAHLSRLEGNAECRSRAEAFFRSEEVVNPERMAGLLVPGFAPLAP